MFKWMMPKGSPRQKLGQMTLEYGGVAALLERSRGAATHMVL